MNKDILSAFGQLLKPLKRGLQGIISRAVITLINDSGDFQILQVERNEDEVSDDLERFGSYGMTSWPKAGAECVVVSAGGVRSHGLVIGVEDRRYRFKLGAEGEVALYDDQGQVVHLKRDGIRIESTFKVDVVAPVANVTADTTNVSGDANVAGNAVVEGDAAVKGQVKLGGDAPVKFVMLADGTASTRVKAL